MEQSAFLCPCIVTAPSANSFKNKLDKHWALQELSYTIGEQNYQEPGVEAELKLEFFEFHHNVFLNNDMAIEVLCFHP